jgi:hypothetical protein
MVSFNDSLFILTIREGLSEIGNLIAQSPAQPQGARFALFPAPGGTKPKL